MSKKTWIWVIIWVVIMPVVGATSAWLQYKIFNEDGKLGDFYDPLNYLLAIEFVAMIIMAIFLFSLFTSLLTFGLLSRIWFGREGQSAERVRPKFLIGIVVVTTAIVVGLLPIQDAIKLIWVAAIPEFVWITLGYNQTKISHGSSHIPVDFWILWATFSILGFLISSRPNSVGNDAMTNALTNPLYFILGGLSVAVWAAPWTSLLKIVFNQATQSNFFMHVRHP